MQRLSVVIKACSPHSFLLFRGSSATTSMKSISSSSSILVKQFNKPSHKFYSSPTKNEQEEEQVGEQEEEAYLTDEEIIKSIPEFRPMYFHEIMEKAREEGKSLEKMTPQQQQVFRDNFKRRISMYCRNRGRVETELFLGGFAREHVPYMNDWKELEDFYDLLCEHDSDLYNWMIATEKDRKNPEWIAKLPERWRNSEMLERVLSYVDSKRAIKYYETNEQQQKPTPTNKGNATFNEDYDATDSGEIIKK